MYLFILGSYYLSRLWLLCKLCHVSNTSHGWGQNQSWLSAWQILISPGDTRPTAPPPPPPPPPFYPLEFFRVCSTRYDLFTKNPLGYTRATALDARSFAIRTTHTWDFFCSDVVVSVRFLFRDAMFYVYSVLHYSKCVFILKHTSKGLKSAILGGNFDNSICVYLDSCQAMSVHTVVILLFSNRVINS